MISTSFKSSRSGKESFYWKKGARLTTKLKLVALSKFRVNLKMRICGLVRCQEFLQIDMGELALI